MRRCIPERYAISEYSRETVDSESSDSAELLGSAIRSADSSIGAVMMVFALLR